jgi:DmsE family decaheme c-type cytochrome
MKKLRIRVLHFVFVLTFAGAVGLALNVNRSLSAEESIPAAPEAAAESAETSAPTTAPVIVEEPRTSENAEFIGADSCAACHQDQVDAFKNAKHGKALPKMKGIEFEKSCETCHGAGSLHAGAGGDKLNPGFYSVKIQEASLSTSCSQCHEKSHWKGSPHDRAGVSCSACHSVHHANNTKAQVKTAKIEDTCYTCHRNVKAEMRRSAHMPVEEGKMGCSSCHDVHGTAAQKSLKAANVPQLCYQCHQEKRGPFLWDHIPVRENCGNCHHPHGSHHDKMLTAKQPFLCQRCHIFDRHPSTVYDGSDVKEQRNYIFGQSCMGCHSNIHGSNHPAGKMFTR